MFLSAVFFYILLFYIFHLILIFIMDLNLTVFSWNCQGCASNKFLKAFREHNLDYKPDIACFLEPRVSGKNTNSVICNLNFQHSHRIEATRFSGGIWVCWKENINISIIFNHPQFMLIRVSDNGISNSIYISFVFCSPNKGKHKVL